MKYAKKIIPVLIIFGMLGCAKRPVILELENGVRPVVTPKKQKVLLITKIQHSVTNEVSNSFNRNILGEWRDLLIQIKNKKIRIPLTINISGDIVRRLAWLEQNEPSLDSVMTLDPDKLSPDQINYLKQKYQVSAATASLLSGQINEALSYLGEDLINHSLVLNLTKKNSYNNQDKNDLLDFMKTKIGDFSILLRMVLDMESIDEAITSLSDAYLDLLDSERIKVQILESMVKYKRWRGRFPDGFIPRGGHLNKEAIEQLEKTSIKWITVVSSGPKNYIRTNPQILFTDAFFFVNHSTPALSDFIDNVLLKKDEVSILITDFKNIEMLLTNKYLNWLSFENFREKVLAKQEQIEIVKLSSSTFRPVSVVYDVNLSKMKNFLDKTRRITYEYRNSGRASLDVLMDIQERLVKAETGELYENIGEKKYDRIFRKSLIDVYRKMRLSPPLELFIPVVDPIPFQPDEEIKATVNVICDGNIEHGEWDGAFKVSISTSQGNLSQIYCGFDKNNIYYMLKFSTHMIDSAGVLVGHINADSAALVHRGNEVNIENVQDFPVYLDISWRKSVPDKTIIYRTTGNEEWEPLTGNYDVGYSSGILEFLLPFKYLDVRPYKKIYLKFYVNNQIFPADKFFIVTAPDFKISRSPISYLDPEGDNYGPGNYKYPESIEDLIGNFDFKKVRVDKKNGEKLITLEIASLENPDSAPGGFSFPVIDIYIDINGRAGLGNTNLLDGRKAYTSPKDAWEYCIQISGWEKSVYNTAMRKIGEPEITVSPWNNTINIFISDELIPASVESWGIIPILMVDDGKGNIVEIKAESEENIDQYRGRKSESDTNIIDVILPPGYQQKKVLGANRIGKSIELPALRKR